MAMSAEQVFLQHIQERYEGKVWRIERTTALNSFDEHLIVRVEFHIPVSEADELEMFRRINRVLEVIADGDKD